MTEPFDLGTWEQVFADSPSDHGRIYLDPDDPADAALLACRALENQPVLVVGSRLREWFEHHAPTGWRRLHLPDPDTLAGRLALCARFYSHRLTVWEARFAGDLSGRPEATWTGRQRFFAKKVVRRLANTGVVLTGPLAARLVPPIPASRER